MEEVRIIPPLAGVNQNAAYSDQPVGTARDALNAVSVSYADQQTRLAKRPGWGTYNTNQLNGSNKVSDLGQVVSKRLVIDYATVTSGDCVFEKQTRFGTGTGGGIGAAQVAAASNGDIYALAADANTFYRLNQEGVVLSATAIPVQEGLAYCSCIAVDEQFNVFVGLSVFTTTTAQPAIWRFQLQPDGTFERIWSLNSNAAEPNNVERVKALVIRGGRMYTLQTDDDAATPTRWLRVYNDIYDNAGPRGLSVDVNIDSAAGIVRPRGLAVNSSGEIVVTYLDTTPAPDTQYVRKFDASGNDLYSSSSTGTGDGGGISNAVEVDGNDNFYTVGPVTSGSGHNQTIACRWLDTGSAMTVAARLEHTGSWSNGPTDVSYQRIHVDAFNNLHFTWPHPTLAPNVEYSYQCYASTLGDETDYLLRYQDSALYSTIALPPTNPDFLGSAVPPDHPEYVWCCGPGNTIQKLRALDITSKTGTNRAFAVIAVSGQKLLVVPSGAGSPTEKGTDIFTAGARYVQIATLFSKAYIVNGIDYKVYDAEADSVSDWESSTSGLIPQRCQIVEPWRGRLVLAGDPDNRHLWHMSAMGEPTNWDLFPLTVTSTVAVSGAVAPALRDTPEIIQSLVPWSNDWLLFGGDHSIHLLRGDPAQGGTLDAISNTIGMAFGRPWCIGPRGTLFWLANRGGVYMMQPGAMPEPLSRDRLKSELDDIDLATYYARMVWDHEREGLWLFFCPYGAGGSIVKQYFWSARTDAWWPCQIGVVSATRNQPTAAFSIDNDAADDRLMLIGTENGLVLQLDGSETSDNGDPVDCWVLLGPWVAQDGIRNLKMRDLWATLSQEYHGLRWEVYVADEPDILPTVPAASGTFAAGRNSRFPVRRQGGAVWLRLHSSGPDETFALESLSTRMGYGDKVRV